MNSTSDKLSYIFDVSCDSEDLLDMYIIQKIMDSDNSVDYFSQCFNRSIEHKMETTVLKQFMNYIIIDMEGNTVQSITKNINENNFNFVEYFFKHIFESKNTELINSFMFALVEIPYGIERTSKLNIMLQSKFIRENMFHEVYNDGITNEMKGYFTLFSDAPSKGWDVNIELIKPLLDKFINDVESCSKLVKLVHRHLNLNISYSYSQQRFIVTNKCASIKHVCFLVKIMLYIFENIKWNSSYVDDDVNRSEYELKNNDSLLAQVIITTLLSLKIGCNPLARLRHTIEKERQSIEEQIDFVNNINLNIMKKKTDLELKFSRVDSIYSDKKFYGSMLNFIEKISENNIIISDDAIHNVNDFVIGCIIDHEMKMLPVSIIMYLLKVIHGDYGANKHERFTVSMTLILICDNIGYTFFNDLNDENMSITTLLFFSVLKFIINIDHFEWTQPKFAHKFYQEMMGILSYYSDKINIRDNCDEISKDLSLLFHKITSKMNTLITDMNEVCRKLLEAIKGLSVDMTIVREQAKQLLNNDFIKTFMACIQTLQKLIENNILDIKNLPIELVLPLSAFTIALLTLLSNGKGPIYTVFQMNMETLDLMQELFKLINIGCSNSHFIQSIQDNIHMVNDMVKRVKLDDKTRNSLINHLNNLSTTPRQDELSLPDEFIDPILAIEIMNPVMIPKEMRYSIKVVL